MKTLYEQHRVRYPPFEASRWEAGALPIATRRYALGDYANVKDAKKALEDHEPEFRIGNEEQWLMERKFIFDGEELNKDITEPSLEDKPYVRLIERQRRGWYLIPNPIHNILRSFINGVVIVLLVCLFYLFISPILLLFNLPVYGCLLYTSPSPRDS